MASTAKIALKISGTSKETSRGTPWPRSRRRRRRARTSWCRAHAARRGGRRARTRRRRSSRFAWDRDREIMRGTDEGRESALADRPTQMKGADAPVRRILGEVRSKAEKGGRSRAGRGRAARGGAEIGVGTICIQHVANRRPILTGVASRAGPTAPDERSAALRRTPPEWRKTRAIAFVSALRWRPGVAAGARHPQAGTRSSTSGLTPQEYRRYTDANPRDRRWPPIRPFR